MLIITQIVKSVNKLRSEDIKIMLVGFPHEGLCFVFFTVISLFCPDIKYHPDGEEVEV